MSHSPEPWEVGFEHETMCQIVAADGTLVAVAKGGLGIRLPNYQPCSPHDIAERIVACVNACRGIKTEGLLQVANGTMYLEIIQPTEYGCRPNGPTDV